jgi:valyl-tRNA synthetase
VVATTRPETMLGDTAVAVNPEDERYRNLEHDTVILPLMNREIPIIKDSYVDMSFGTGGLKITPAHDPNDFEIGGRHNLPSVKVISDDGDMTAEAGRFEGMGRFECREAVVGELEKEGLLVKVEPYKHSVGHCYRCKTVVEPNLSKQWFVRAKPLAEEAIAAVKSGKTKITPEMWTNTYYDWMNNIRDWCVSRQIWWGHQIPAWTCDECSEMVVAMEAPQSCPACNAGSMVQETDVLDTWFSSALWPFSTMGWPEETPLLQTFYPTSVLVTGFDILFFWVARMMMMGIHFMHDIPFKDVYVHALVRDEDGKKMSKSKGNVIDPLSVIDRYGTDAFRFTLAAFAAQGRDIKMSEKRVEGYRHFINKLWNASRFALMHLDRGYEDPNPEKLSLPDQWIISRLRRVAAQVSSDLDSYRFNEAAGALYNFVWHEFCDWYLETVKPALYDNKGAEAREAARAALWLVLHETLVLLHPFIPFVTEEIWQHLPGTNGSIMKAAYPPDSVDQDAENQHRETEFKMGILIEVVTGIRNVRGEMNIAPSLQLRVLVQTDHAETTQIIDTHRDLIMTLARLDSLEVQRTGKRPPSSATAVINNATVFVSLEGIIDFAMETQRLEKEMNKLDAELLKVGKKLSNEGFLSKAPADVIKKVREKQDVLLEKQGKIQANLDRIKEAEA